MSAVAGPGPQAREIICAVEMQAGFDRLANELQPLINTQECVLLGVMNGGLYPLMELASRLQGDFLLDYCHATRYRERTRGDDIEWLRRPPDSVAGRTALVVDDILDVGDTLEAVLAECRVAGAVAVHSVVQVVKDTPVRPAGRSADYCTGLTVPDVYVFGCGMDVAGRWRHLPAIYEWPAGTPLPDYSGATGV